MELDGARAAREEERNRDKLCEEARRRRDEFDRRRTLELASQHISYNVSLAQEWESDERR